MFNRLPGNEMYERCLRVKAIGERLACGFDLLLGYGRDVFPCAAASIRDYPSVRTWTAMRNEMLLYLAMNYPRYSRTGVERVH